ncbi:MAG: hypothetical protein NTX61_03525 [Bacteroidetes bacterium]|nr:hypothetical protein [Bacteroidota bacterium]
MVNKNRQRVVRNTVFYTREHSEPKWKLITNHTARKTFITNSIVLGMNTKTIKDITGHKKDSVFNKYVKISEEFKKLEMERTWDNIQTITKKPGLIKFFISKYL